MTGEDANQLIAEVGPLDDRITGVARLSDGQWAIGIADADVEIDLLEDGRRLILSAAIAVPPEDRTAAVAEALLAFSALWRETGFVHAAWAGQGQPATLVVNLLTAGLSANQLALVLGNLADKTRLWREFFFAASDSEKAPAFDPMDFAGQPLIRV